MYEYKIELKRVIDGDTIIADIDLGFDVKLSNESIRLHGIDAPESRTRDLEEKRYGQMSTEFLVEQLEGKDLILQSLDYGKGKFGRVIGTILADGVNINELMIESHMAVRYETRDIMEAAHLENRKALSEK